MEVHVRSFSCLSLSLGSDERIDQFGPSFDSGRLMVRGVSMDVFRSLYESLPLDVYCSLRLVCRSSKLSLPAFDVAFSMVLKCLWRLREVVVGDCQVRRHGGFRWPRSCADCLLLQHILCDLSSSSVHAHLIQMHWRLFDSVARGSEQAWLREQCSAVLFHMFSRCRIVKDHLIALHCCSLVLMSEVVCFEDRQRRVASGNSSGACSCFYFIHVGCAIYMFNLLFAIMFMGVTFFICQALKNIFGDTWARRTSLVLLA